MPILTEIPNIIRLSQQECETLLDAGKIRTLMGIRWGRYWQTKRNGRTQVGKTHPGYYSIPIKIGFRNYGYLTNSTRFDTQANPYVPEGTFAPGNPSFRIFDHS